MPAVRSPAANHDAGEVFTIGHSTHPPERFLELLSAHRIAALADVRSFPSSRRWPQFNQEQLRASVERRGIEYHWLQKLGGRRRGLGDASPHLAWQHPAFRSYADYADTPEFEQGLGQLIALARRARTAFMCSEGLWWRCHRRLISDRLLLLGWRVRHILPGGKLTDHALPAFARVLDGRLVYDRNPADDY